MLDKTDKIISLGGNDTNQKKKLLPLTSDVIFKAVFSRPGNEDILKSLLEAILDIDIKEVQVQNTELPVDSFDNKAGVMDIKVRVDEDIICDIEMQVKNVWNIDHRSTYYISKNLSSEMRRGDDYKAVKKSIGINLLAFEFYKRNSYRSIAHMKFEKTKKEEYIDMGYTDEDEIATTDLEMHFIELPKFIKKAPEPKTKLEQWLYFIAGREEKMKDIEKRVKEILKTDVVDENRIAQEVVIYADKCSVEEEVTRLNSHISQFKELLKSDENVGKKLDFIIQEMNRETNTIGSKANNLEITNGVIDIKTELEDIREQIQNIE